MIGVDPALKVCEHLPSIVRNERHGIIKLLERKLRVIECFMGAGLACLGAVIGEESNVKHKPIIP